MMNFKEALRADVGKCQWAYGLPFLHSSSNPAPSVNMQLNWICQPSTLATLCFKTWKFKLANIASFPKVLPSAKVDLNLFFLSFSLRYAQSTLQLSTHFHFQTRLLVRKTPSIPCWRANCNFPLYPTCHNSSLSNLSAFYLSTVWNGVPTMMFIEESFILLKCWRQIITFMYRRLLEKLWYIHMVK